MLYNLDFKVLFRSYIFKDLKALYRVNFSKDITSLEELWQKEFPFFE